MGREEIREKVYDLSCGVVATAIDLVLMVFFYGLETGTAGYGPPNVARAADKAYQRVAELGIEKETVKKAVYKATHRHLIRRPKKGIPYWKITKEGKTRLQSLLPQYNEKRTWDGRLYLVIYDILEKQHSARDTLRKYLKKIGCGMLQASVWLTPYNPTGTLRQFIKENNLSGAVIISSIGKDGSIGEEDLDDLIERIYQLGDLNNRYEGFIYRAKKERLNRAQIAFEFLSILNDDPQLPFEILPYNWQGEKAYKLFKKFFPNVTTAVADLGKKSDKDHIRASGNQKWKNF